MEVRAVARFIRVQPRKARIVGELIKGKHVHDALAILKFTPNASARVLEKLLESAIANAENNNHLDGDALKVQQVTVDQGPSLKRIQPRAMGRAYRILKRTSHIAIILTEAEARPSRKRKEEPKRRLLSRRRKAAPEEAAAQGHRRGRKAAAAPEEVREEQPAVVEEEVAEAEAAELEEQVEPEAAAQEAAAETETAEVEEPQTAHSEPSVEESGEPTESESNDKPEGGQ